MRNRLYNETKIQADVGSKKTQVINTNKEVREGCYMSQTVLTIILIMHCENGKQIQKRNKTMSYHVEHAALHRLP